MVSCSVTGCKSRSSAAFPQTSSQGVSYHAFPFERQSVLEQWLSFTKKPSDWFPTRYSRICSRHFPKHCYYTKPAVQPRGVRKNPRFLKPMAVPSVSVPRCEEKISEEEKVLEVGQDRGSLAEDEMAVKYWTGSKSTEGQADPRISALTGEDPMMAVQNIDKKSEPRQFKSESAIKREFEGLDEKLSDSFINRNDDTKHEDACSDVYSGNQLHHGNSVDSGVKNAKNITPGETNHLTSEKAECTEDKKPVFRWKINDETNQIELCLKGSSDDDSSDHSSEDLNDVPSMDPNLMTFHCEECNEQFSKRSLLKKHRRSVHRPAYECTVCQMKFNHKGNLNNHTMRMHTTERPFSCSYCGKGFTRKFELRDHVRTHTGERPFVCGDCNSSFALLHQLKRHSKLHTKLKLLYPCMHCDKIFCRADRMIRHKRTCAKSETFACKMCNESFDHIHELTKHQKMHEQPLICAECNEYFPNRAKLNEHSQTHCWDKVVYLDPPRKTSC